MAKGKNGKAGRRREASAIPAPGALGTTVEFLTLDAIHEKLRQLLPSGEFVPDRTHIEEMLGYNILFARKRYNDPSLAGRFSNEEMTAKLLASIIPKESLRELHYRADVLNDPAAMLALGDCYYMKLKWLPDRDIARGNNYTHQAAMLGNPEAMTHVAFLTHIVINTMLQPGLLPHSKEALDPIPPGWRLHPEVRRHMEDMWAYLEHAAAANWISPFLLRETQQAVRMGSWTPSPKIMQIMAHRQREVEEEKEVAQRKHIHRCSNTGCTLRADNTANMKTCSRCRNAKYCSKACQLAHWRAGHKRECKPALTNSEERHVNTSISSSRGSEEENSEMKAEHSDDEDDILLSKPGSSMMSINLANGQKMDLRSTTMDLGALRNALKREDTEAHRRRIESRTRLQQSGALNVSVQDLQDHAELEIERAHYSRAARSLTFAIDKLHVDNPVYGVNSDERKQYAKLLLRRAWCNLKAAEACRSIPLVDVVIEDCIFVLHTGTFEAKDLSEKALAEFRSIEEEGEKLLKTLQREESEMLTDSPKEAPEECLETKTEETSRLNGEQYHEVVVEESSLDSSYNDGQAQSAALAVRRVGRRGDRLQRERERRRRRQQEERRLQRRNASSSPGGMARQERLKAVFPAEEEEDLKDLDMISCLDIAAAGCAINASSNEECCPICQTEWGQFIEPSLAVVLPCGHALCASCLSRFYAECQKPLDSDYAGDDAYTFFSCTICRRRLPRRLLEEMAAIVVEQQLVNSFSLLTNHLPVSVIERERLLQHLLVQHSFDVVKVEDVLFNMLGLLTDPNTSSELTTEDKQEFYQIARAPVQKLQDEYVQLRQKLSSVLDTSTRSWKLKYKKLTNLRHRLAEARLNAAKDIFERMNNAGGEGMGRLEEDRETGCVKGARDIHVDLHGLHVREAKEILLEFVLPILPVVRKVVLITGRGAHSEAGVGVLKPALKEFVRNFEAECNSDELHKLLGQRLVCEDVMRNDGLLKVRLAEC